MKKWVGLFAILTTAAAGDDYEEGFHCWTEANQAIRCQWPKDWAEYCDLSNFSTSCELPKVVYFKTYENYPDLFYDCYSDEFLTTSTKVGCTIRYANAFINYTLRLIATGSNRKFGEINDFIGQNYIKITDPLIDFDAERYENGTVHLEWNYNSSQKFLNSLYGERIVLLLLFRPFMQSGPYSERILGYQKDLQHQIYLNDLPNSQVLELCIRVRKKDSKVKSWSPCSNKAILRPVNLPSNEPSPTATPINVTCDFTFCNPSKQNTWKTKVVIATSFVILFMVFFILGCVLKINWRRIKNYILPPLPTPRVQFAEDSEDEESGALFVERNDILDTTLALNASGFDQTNRTESTFLSSPNDTTYNETELNDDSGVVQDIQIENHASSQKSLDSGFSAEPSMFDRNNCSGRPKPSTTRSACS